MFLDDNKYHTLFINKFNANETQLKNEFERIINEHGNSEEIKLNFYRTVFNILINQYKKDVPKNENYDIIITNLYNYFIQTLKDDEIDTTKYESELEIFKSKELPKINLLQPYSSTSTAGYKTYNLNTNYGRRKAREQALRNYENGTPEYRNEIDSIKTVIWVIIFVIAIVVIVIKIL